MNKKILFALLLGALAFTNAEETIIEDLGEEDTTTQVSGKKTRPKLSPEERAQRIAQKKQLMDKMEACLIMVRAFYAKNTKKYDDYIMGHIST